ncbi:MAG TPA: response regulator transcription factor [Thermoanaerobaculia bacterium]|nr:response regulator transcription factor [Thermoanaerobaculia bacterium]
MLPSEAATRPFPRPLAVPAPIRVALVDSFPLLHVALCNVLGAERDIEVVGEAQDAWSALDLLRRVPAQVALVETSLVAKDPLEATREMLQLAEAPRVLVLAHEANPHYALRMLRAGALGFLPTQTASEEVVRAVRSLAQNRVYLPPGLHEILTDRYLRQSQPQLPEDLLSDREFEVMRLLALGHTTREIAARLFIGIKTVDTHRANLLRKLDLRHNVDVARFAIQNGFVACAPLVRLD